MWLNLYICICDSHIFDNIVGINKLTFKASISLVGIKKAKNK